MTNEKPAFKNTCENFEVSQEPVKKIRKYSPSGTLKGQASGGERFANYIIDRIITFVLTIALGFLIAGGGYTVSILEDYLITYLLIIFYFAILEGTTGQSVGKMITGTIVVDNEGKKPEFGQILGRTLCRFIPFEAFSFLGESASGWHDSISNTRVIKKSAYMVNIQEPDLLDQNL